MAQDWLRDAVFYEIYPQSFYDSNNDGIGDINGIIEKLPYIASLGVNALWINPCFDSPFRDAGYDVKDYLKVAPRYGNNNDLYRLFGLAHERGIRVLLDLVPGHTSEEHMWFKASCSDEKNAFSDRFIWMDGAFHKHPGLTQIGGEAERDGTYVVNFFKCQPALNYGFLKPEEPWQNGTDDPAAKATRDAMKDVIRFWCSHGCDGFRVDMAASLVKLDDEEKSGTRAAWEEIIGETKKEFPEIAFVAEWSNPPLSLSCGFDADFMLNERGGSYASLAREYWNHEGEAPDKSWFKKDAGGSFAPFKEEYGAWYEATKDKGYISLISCNHDTIRPAFNLDDRERRLFFAFLFTMPGVPFLYYGDEIGMRYLKLKTHEGGYFRTGSRTPMQWDKSANLGFSKAPADALYLPVDGGEDAPNVDAQEEDKTSLLNEVRGLIALRHGEKDLQADGGLAFLQTEDVLVYRRGDLVCACNPSGHEVALSPGIPALPGDALYTIGEAKGGEAPAIGAQSFAVWRVKT